MSKQLVIKIFIFSIYFVVVKSQIFKSNQTWSAVKKLPDGVTIEQLKTLNGVLGIHPDPTFQIKVKNHIMGRTLIPENFDARKQWPKCNSTINNIRNQGHCGSCWAFAAAEVMSDRLCIQSDGKIQFEFSAEDLLECCPTCGKGCGGGYIANAWNYWITVGIVSGGDTNTYRGCKPYSISAFTYNQSPKCSTTCSNTNYSTSYEKDKKFGASYYQLPSKNVQQIQTEIMNNGPVETVFLVYEDFYYYDSGVYQHTSGPLTAKHAVKIIGWGSENGTPYWLIANSWGSEWGGLQGYFKILRGQNHCGIEEMVFGGEANLDSIISNTTSSSEKNIINTILVLVTILILFSK